MKTYYEKWKFKHPSPADVRTAFEETSQKNLSWFFDDLLGTTKKIDYAITSCHKTLEEDGLSFFVINLKNKGGVNGPISLTSIEKNGKAANTTWIEPIGKKKEIILSCFKCLSPTLKIDNDFNIADINRKNNFISNSVILQKWNAPKS